MQQNLFQQPPAPREAWKTKFLSVLFLLGFSGVLVRLFLVQVVNGADYRERAQRQYESTIELRADRGTIYDRNGRVIASTIQSTSVAVDPNVLQNAKRISQILANSTGIPAKEYMQKISGTKNSFVWLARSLTSTESASLDTVHDRGFLRYYEPRRSFSYGPVGAQVIGCTNVDNKGLSGIELGWDSLLHGRQGYTTMLRDGRGNLRPDVSADVAKPLNGKSLVLTLDMEIQSIVEYELQRGIAESRATSGIAVAIEPSTGEILAMANYPTFDPNDMKNASGEAMRNRAITDMYEPGSTFKLVTAAAALEERVITPRDTVDAYGGKLALQDYTIYDSHPLGKVTFAEAMEQSSNVVFALTAKKIPDAKFYKYARDFGFGIPLGIDMPGEVSGRIKKPNEFDATTKLFMAYGYQLGATALQIASAYATVANKGIMMKPFLVKKVLDEEGEEEEKFSPQKIRQVISEESAGMLKDILVGVVERGTGIEAKVDGIRVAGKTGTAQQLVDGKYSKQDYTASFAGFFPADHPKIAMVIMLDKPQADYYGGKTAAPIFGRIVRRIAGASEIQNSDVKIVENVSKKIPDSVTVPDIRGLEPDQAENLTRRIGLRIRKNAGSGKILAQKPAPGQKILRGGEVHAEIQKTGPASNTQANGARPDVRGMTARRALAVLHSARIKTRILGSGVVVRQSWQDAGICVLECE